MEGRCEACRFWGIGEGGWVRLCSDDVKHTCWEIATGGDNGGEIICRENDTDPGEIYTGPQFGCVRYEPKATEGK